MTALLDDLLHIETSARIGAGIGNSVDQVTLGHALADKALELSESSYLEEAEFWYKEAIKNGDESLKSYFINAWPLKKETYKQMILKGEK